MYDARPPVPGGVGRRSGPVHTVEVDGVTHTIARDEGGVVRAPAPAVVVSVAVSPGDEVAVGDPLVVLESMKMETTVTAEFPGRVSSVLVAPERAGRRGRAARSSSSPSSSTRSAAPAAPSSSTSVPADRDRRRRLDALRAYLLGYDLDPATMRRIDARR